MFKRKVILKDFHEFHKYNIGDKVLVKWEHYNEKMDRVATIRSISITFTNGEQKPHEFYGHRTSLFYYFKEFEGWLDEDKIIRVL
jgi:hypothetical protein